MSQALFGKDITRVFYPEDGRGNSVALPTQTPLICLWDKEPTPAECLSGTGAVSTVSAWTASGAVPYAYTYTLPAIADPTPLSVLPQIGYWESIAYILQAAGSTVLCRRYLEIDRVQAPLDKVGTTKFDLQGIYSEITSYFKNDSEIDAAIKTAENEMRLDIKAAGIKYETVMNLDEARLALAYKTIANRCLSQIQSVGDRHDRKYSEYIASYRDALTKIPFRHDTDGDGIPEAESTSKAKYSVMFR